LFAIVFVCDRFWVAQRFSAAGMAFLNAALAAEVPKLRPTANRLSP
jgi:hypothetical protein